MRTRRARSGTQRPRCLRRRCPCSAGAVQSEKCGHETKKRLQGFIDIGILYTPNSFLERRFQPSALFERNHRESIMAKAKKGKAKKKVSKAKKPAKKKSARKPNAAFMKPMTPSSTLAGVIGGSPMPRTEVTKKLWQYIKRNGLQDRTNKRMINADDKLKPVFGGRSQVSMFEMTKLVSNHLR